MVRANKIEEVNGMVVNKFVLCELLDLETELRKLTVNTTNGNNKVRSAYNELLNVLYR